MRITKAELEDKVNFLQMELEEFKKGLVKSSRELEDCKRELKTKQSEINELTRTSMLCEHSIFQELKTYYKAEINEKICYCNGTQTSIEKDVHEVTFLRYLYGLLKWNG